MARLTVTLTELERHYILSAIDIAIGDGSIYGGEYEPVPLARINRSLERIQKKLSFNRKAVIKMAKEAQRLGLD